MNRPMRSEIVVQDGKVLHLGLEERRIAPNVFLVGDPARAFRVAERFDAVDCDVRNREFVTLTGWMGETPVSVIGTGIGVDNVEIAIVEAYAVHAFDFETRAPRPGAGPMRFLRIGTSAGIQDDLEPGVLAISTYGLGLDNAGLYYDHPPADALVERIEAEAARIVLAATPEGARFRGRLHPYASRASPDVVTALVASSRRLGVEAVTGITASTPGFYGASSREIEGLANTVRSIKTALAGLGAGEERVVNMEMESSLLFHVAGHLGCAAGTICPIISGPRASTAILDYGDAVSRAIDVALDAMRSLSRR